MTQFLVKSPAVGVKVGGRVSIFYRGGVVSGAEVADAERLEAEGHLERIDAPAPPADELDEGGDGEPSAIPAKEGPGSGKARWADYAESLGVEVPEGAAREAIIQAIAEAGHPTE